jgi:hypothetical protein
MSGGGRSSKKMAAPKQELYITLDEQGQLKIGTCQHCVVEEPMGRPARAWDAEGDKDLDFDRDGLAQALEALGVKVDIESQFICP